MKCDNPVKHCLTLFTAAAILVGCQSTDTMNETAATDGKGDYELVSMKKDSDVYNASADKSAVVSRRVGTDEEQPDQEMQTTRETHTQSIDRTEEIARNDNQQVEREVLFEFDSAHLTPEAEQKLDQLVESAQRTGSDTMRIQLAGHADALGPDEYNQQLSRDRAEAVKDYLDDQLTVSVDWNVNAYGESRPVASNETPSGRQENRRVKLRLLDS